MTHNSYSKVVKVGSANHIEAEIRWSHFHCLVWESFSVDVQKLFVFGPKQVKFNDACRFISSEVGSMVQGSLKMSTFLEKT